MNNIRSLVINGAFGRLLIARSVSAIGSGVTGVALAFAILGNGGDASTLGLVLGFSAIPQVLLLIIGGAAGDRFCRKTLLVAADIVMFAFQSGTAAVLLATKEAPVGWLLVMQAGFGVGRAFFWPASTAYIVEIVPKNLLQRANSVLQTTKSSALVAGPAIGGILVTVSSPEAALFFDACTYLISATLIGTTSTTTTKPSELGKFVPSMMSDLREGWNYFRRTRWLLTMVGGFSVYQATVLAAITVLGPIIAQTNLGGAAAWSAILVARAAGSVVGSAIGAKSFRSNPLVLAVTVTLFDVPFLVLLALSGDVILLAAFATISALSVAWSDVVWSTTLQSAVPSRLMGRVSSYDWMGSLAAAPIGFVVIGAFANAVGARNALIAVAGLHLAMCFLITVLRPIRSFSMPSVTPVPTPQAEE